MVSCKHCGRHQPVEAATKRTFYDGKQWLDHYYCGQHCLEQWYINQLRMLGL